MADRNGIFARLRRGFNAFMGVTSQRMYNAARASRLTADWAPANGSADSELVSSLRQLRTRSRALCRDVSYAKRAKQLVVNNVIGSGIGMQGQVYTTRDELNTRVNDDIEEAFCAWSAADSCHTGGRLDFSAFERACMAQVFEAGEVFVRKHYREFGSSKVPFALELIEAERIADDLTDPFAPRQDGNQVRMGIEVDEFFRPVAYYIRSRHPSEFQFVQGRDTIERVPANQIIHLAILDRWPQTRGEPWMHPVITTFKDMAGYTEAEITRARSQACTIGAIETPEDAASLGEEQNDGSVVMEVEPGIFKRLNPGEKLVAGPMNSPNPALEGFMRYMLREVAAGVGPSYESLSRDYSQSNYSSSRLALLDDRDLWRAFQSWFICNFRAPIHKEWLRQAVFARAIETVPVQAYALDPAKFEAVRFKPRGWSWVDPTKEVDAYVTAINAGLTTVTDVVSQTANGQDIEDVLATRDRELKLMRQKGLVFETSPEFYTKDAQPPTAPPDNPDTTTDTPQDPAESRVFRFQPRK
jgi:lambda family phage portal protein